MNVRMVDGENGSHPEPPLDPTWTDREKLEWNAALVSHLTGLNVLIMNGSYQVKRWGRWVEDQPHYSVVVQGPNSASSTVLSFKDAWTYINGIQTGARAIAGEGA